MSKSVLASPGGASAGRTRWKRRSKLTKVPSFSRKDAAGSTTSARSAVRDRNSSWQTTSSQASSAACTRRGVRVGLRDVLADDVQRPQPPRRARRANISGMRSPGRAGTRTPQAASNRARTCGVGDALVAGQQVGQRAHVRGALDVVLPAQRNDAAAAGGADGAREDGQVGQRADAVGAVGVLGDAEAVDDRRLARGAVEPRRRGAGPRRARRRAPRPRSGG